MSKFITNINCEFHECKIIFKENDYSDQLKLSVNKIFFKLCTLESSSYDINDFELSSRRSVASYSEHAKEDETVDFIQEFCIEYQSTKKWLLMLNQQFAPEQLYEVEIKYCESVSNNYSKDLCNMILKIVKEKIEISDEEFEEIEESNNYIGKFGIEETKAKSQYDEDIGDLNYYAIFNSSRYNHHAYAFCQNILDPRFFALVLYESKYCTKLEIECLQIRASSSKSLYMNFNLNDQHIKSLVLNGCGFMEIIDSSLGLTEDEKSDDAYFLQILKDHRESFCMLKLLKYSNLIYSLNNLYLKNAFKINIKEIGELLDEIECKRDNHSSKSDPISIDISVKFDVKAKPKLPSKQEQFRQRRREILSLVKFPLLKIFYEKYIPVEFEDLAETSIKSRDSQYVYWEMYHEPGASGVHAINSILQSPQFSINILIYVAYSNNLLKKTKINRQNKEERNLLWKGDATNLQINHIDNFNTCLKERGVNKITKIVNFTQMQTMEEYNNCNAFLCTDQTHWFALRKVHDLWFDLDSKNKFPGPQIIPNYALVEVLSSYSKNGFEIYMVVGKLPNPDVRQPRELKDKQFYLSLSELISIYEKNNYFKKNFPGSENIDHLLSKHNDCTIYNDTKFAIEGKVEKVERGKIVKIIYSSRFDDEERSVYKKLSSEERDVLVTSMIHSPKEVQNNRIKRLSRRNKQQTKNTNIDSNADPALIYYQKYTQGTYLFLPVFNNIMQETIFNNQMLEQKITEMKQEYNATLNMTGVPIDMFEKNEYTSNIAANKYNALESLLQIRTDFKLESLNTPWSRSIVKRDYSQEHGFIGSNDNHWIAIRKIHEIWFYFDYTSERSSPDIIDSAYLNEFIELIIERNYYLFAIKTNFGLPPHPKSKNNNELDNYQGLKQVSMRHCQNIKMSPEYRNIISDEEYAMLTAQEKQKKDKETLTNMLISNPSNFTNRSLESEINKYSEKYQMIMQSQPIEEDSNEDDSDNDNDKYSDNAEGPGSKNSDDEQNSNTNQIEDEEEDEDEEDQQELERAIALSTQTRVAQD